ncbi:MAG TPA: hypothetical protein VFS43_13950 [Polyangiaceae bacterium]|nr:hypothetical protein [Polyangiaceae bacterium]
MVRHRVLMGALLLGALGAPAAAEAQQPQPGAAPAGAPAAGAAGARPGGRAGAAAATGAKKDEGYAYEFTDDPLAAGGLSPNDATIRVRPGPVRSTLIKPRVSFVPEMLKSVENL